MANIGRPKGATDKKPRKRTKRPKEDYFFSKVANMQQPEGYNTKMISFIMDVMPTERLDKSDPDKCVAEMQRRFNNYLKVCAERDIKVGNQGAYMAIGIDDNTVAAWNNDPRANPKYRDFIHYVKKVCTFYRESLMAEGKVNPVVGIFWQKNYDGLKDQQDVVVTPNNPLGESADAESLRKKYLENTYGIAEGYQIEQKEVIDMPAEMAEGEKIFEQKFAEGGPEDAERALFGY